MLKYLILSVAAIAINVNANNSFLKGAKKAITTQNKK